MHDPLVEWLPKNAKSGAEEQENAMARDAMATIEGDLPLPLALPLPLPIVTALDEVSSIATCWQY